MQGKDRKDLQDKTANLLYSSDIQRTVMHVKTHPTWCLRGIKQTIKAALGPGLLFGALMCSVDPMTCSWPCVTERRGGCTALNLLFGRGGRKKSKHLHLQPTSARGEPEPHYPHYGAAEYIVHVSWQVQAVILSVFACRARQ